MTGYKLTYWNARGRGEPIRMIFAAANVKYEDNRISKELWPTIKQCKLSSLLINFGSKQKIYISQLYM